jgi:hypothetical protein
MDVAGATTPAIEKPVATSVLIAVTTEANRKAAVSEKTWRI